MKKIVHFIGILFLSALSGCSPRSWHFDGATDGQAPQAFIDQANDDFATIMPAYESGSYPGEFDSRFAAGPYTNQKDQFADNSDHGFSVHSYFDPHLRYQEETDEFKRYAAKPRPTGMAVDVLGWQQLPPPEEWSQGYFTAKSQANFSRLLPQMPGSGILSAMISITTAIGGAEGQKLYGFVWSNDFSQAQRSIEASPVGISFTYTWRRYVSVPIDVSMTNHLEEKATVFLDYDDQMKLTGNCSFRETWGVASLH